MYRVYSTVPGVNPGGRGFIGSVSTPNLLADWIGEHDSVRADAAKRKLRSGRDAAGYAALEARGEGVAHVGAYRIECER